MLYPQDETRVRVMAGEFIGCSESDCQKGKVFVEAPGQCALVACPTCSGKGYLVAWRSIDISRLAVPA
jgi:hypothetical protein